MHNGVALGKVESQVTIRCHQMCQSIRYTYICMVSQPSKCFTDFKTTSYRTNSLSLRLNFQYDERVIKLLMINRIIILFFISVT